MEEIAVSGIKLYTPYIKRNEVASLHKMITLKIAIALWRNLFMKHDDTFEYSCMLTCRKPLYPIFKDKLLRLLNTLKLPKVLRQSVEDTLAVTGKEISLWASRHANCHLLDMIDYPEYVKCIVWRSNGEINFNKTANKMLAIPRLSINEKCGIVYVNLMDIWRED